MFLVRHSTKGKSMDRLDDAVRRAAPPALGSDPVAAEHAEAVARAVPAGETLERSRMSRFRRFIAGAALGIGILGLGVTAATAGPAVTEWLGWTPDVVAQRSFDLGEGSDLGLCEVFIRVTPEYRNVSDEEAERRTEEARKFLAAHDWDPLIASITEDEILAEFAAEQAQRAVPLEDGTLPPPATVSGAVTQLMFDRISEEFERAGQLRQGVSLEAAAGQCADAIEGSNK